MADDVNYDELDLYPAGLVPLSYEVSVTEYTLKGGVSKYVCYTIKVNIYFYSQFIFQRVKMMKENLNKSVVFLIF